MNFLLDFLASREAAKIVLVQKCFGLAFSPRVCTSKLFLGSRSTILVGRKALKYEAVA